MTVGFLTEAAEEPAEAALWCESRQPGLGRKYREEVAHVVSRIAQDPLLWRPRASGYRRANCPVFPYFVANVMRQQRIIVVAVGHCHRKPGYWESRVGS